jgi:uncharacterized protein YbjT (DUF2867 family)
MRAETKMILVTGATGTAGRAVIDALRNVGAPFRGMVRNNPATHEVAADFTDKASLKTALAGVDTVFVVCSPIPQLVELEGNMIDACVDAGVSHVVQLSALGAGDYEKSFPSWHRKVEDKLRTSGIGYTILRPNGFFQNIEAFYAPSVRTQGAFYAAMSDAKSSFLDVSDVGSAAAGILASPSAHVGMTYELNGPEAMSYAEIAERISRTVGRPVKYIDIPEEAQRKGMLDLGMPSWQVEAVLELQQYYVSGRAGDVTDVLPSLLGRPPITLDEYLAENKESFTATV